MEEEVSVRVEIAGRVYPLRVKAEEESDIRKAALLINSRLKELQTTYSVTDKQDLIAMCTLQFVTQLLGTQQGLISSNQSVKTKLELIDATIKEYLNHS
jgi:cell division protein ZapA (FtsZ GTPase activity inhibitor)